MHSLVSFLAGLIFAIGLALSGMTDANKVIGFLDLFGQWNPSLAFVMAGAIGTFLVLRLSVKVEKPLFDLDFKTAKRVRLDAPLILGSISFGVGWGLMGFCPGPALVSLASGHRTVLIFVLAMGVGMAVYSTLQRLSHKG
jgi:uncharacterized membrane protein YedE/YeeE